MVMSSQIFSLVVSNHDDSLTYPPFLYLIMASYDYLTCTHWTPIMTLFPTLYLMTVMTTLLPIHPLPDGGLLS